MNIISAQHNEHGGYIVVCDEGDLYVPEAPGNRHYQALMEWVAEGNTIEPVPEPPVVVPQVVYRFQVRAALHLAGLLDTVESIMADPETDMLTRLAWVDAQEFRRDSPTIASMAVELGLTDQQVDELFITAAWIEA